MIKQGLVSVIIPTYGRSDSLKSAVQSVLNQDYHDIEVIIIDDNDDVNTSEQVRLNLASFGNDSRLRYFSDGQNRGGAGARNKGIEISSGQYITFLDDDDLYINNKVSLQMDFLYKNNLDICICDMFFQKDNRFKDVSNCYARGFTLKDFILDGNCYTPMILCKKELLIRVGGFILTPRFQDHLLMIRLLAYTTKVGHLEEKLFIHNNHDGERITYSKKSIAAYELREKIERTHIHLLTIHEKKSFEFKKAVIRMKISRLNHQPKKLFMNTLMALKSLSTFKEMLIFLKTVIRVVVYGSKNV